MQDLRFVVVKGGKASCSLQGERKDALPRAIEISVVPQHVEQTAALAKLHDHAQLVVRAHCHAEELHYASITDCRHDFVLLLELFELFLFGLDEELAGHKLALVDALEHFTGRACAELFNVLYLADVDLIANGEIFAEF
jgi:hypothetical protein